MWYHAGINIYIYLYREATVLDVQRDLGPALKIVAAGLLFILLQLGVYHDPVI